MKIANILIDSPEKKEKLKLVENSFLDYALYLTKGDSLVVDCPNTFYYSC